MAYALRPRPCRNGCGVERQQGRVSDATKCSRLYVCGGKDFPKPYIPSAGCKEVTESLNAVYTHFLHLIDVSEDYRRVFWVIPWAVLVAVYLLTGLPAWILCHLLIIKVGRPVQHLLQYPDPNKRDAFSRLFRLDRHARLRRLLASKSLMAMPMGLLFLLDCGLFLVLNSVFLTVFIPVFAVYLGTAVRPLWMLSKGFIRFKEGEIDDFQHTCCQCLTQRICDEVDFSFAREACVQCRRRDEQWIWVRCGAESLDDKSEWKRVARDTGEVLQLSGAINLAPQGSASHQAQHSTVQPCLISDATLAALQFPMHIMHLPHWSVQIKTLTSLDLSSCRCLETLPLPDILQLPLLTSLSCEGCSQLWSIPQEVCKQGAQATMRFLRRWSEPGGSTGA